MDEDDDTGSTRPILACGHDWDGEEPWEDMAVILKSILDEETGPIPAVATGHYCRACRGQVQGERFGSMDEAWAWLQAAIA